MGTLLHLWVFSVVISAINYKNYWMYRVATIWDTCRKIMIFGGVYLFGDQQLVYKIILGMNRKWQWNIRKTFQLSPGEKMNIDQILVKNCLCVVLYLPFLTKYFRSNNSKKKINVIWGSMSHHPMIQLCLCVYFLIPRQSLSILPKGKKVTESHEMGWLEDTVFLLHIPSSYHLAFYLTLFWVQGLLLTPWVKKFRAVPSAVCFHSGHNNCLFSGQPLEVFFFF